MLMVMLGTIAERARERWREHELSGEQRAGAWSRRRARELQYAFARRNWQVLLGVIVVGVAVAPASLLIPPAPRWFVLGLWTASVVGLLVFFVVVMSGSAYLLTANQAEQWTRQELASLRREGWRVIHRVLLRGTGDIDHVAVGPGGVLVVETKWSTSDWTSPRQRRWIDEAIRQVHDNARQVRLYLRPDIGDAPVIPVVALRPCGLPSMGSRPVRLTNSR